MNVTKLFMHARTVYPRSSFPLFSRVPGNEATHVIAFMTSQAIRFKASHRKWSIRVQGRFMAFVCPDIMPGTIRGGWSNTYIKHSLEDT